METVTALYLAVTALMQTPSLADYLRDHPVPSALTVSADLARAGKTTNLATFGYKIVRLGEINAVVPINMVVFDSSLKQPPNLYDGLPADAKVLYLISTLSPKEIGKAAGEGIGIADLKGEQKSVFASLLPKKVSWIKQRLDQYGDAKEKVGEGEMDEKAILAMRLRLERNLLLQLPLADGSDRSTFHSTNEQSGKPNGTILQRSMEDDPERDESFGVTIRKIASNAVKPGQLDTISLNALASLPSSTTVGEALTRIGAATHREILADLRVKNRTVTFNGGPSRTGDLLDGLALAVEGTYRRVGSAYILTADVEGLGARKLKLSVWENEFRLALEERKAAWQRGLVVSGEVARIGYGKTNGLGPSDSMVADMNAQPDGLRRWIPASELTPELRSFIARINTHPSGTRVSLEKAKSEWRLNYRFVTAEGEAFRSEPLDLGGSYAFRPVAPSLDLPLAAPKPIALDPNRGHGLTVRAQTAKDAGKAAELAKRFGFGELWLETSNAEAITTAIESQLPVRLFVRPWAFEVGDAPDRSILGDTASQAAARIARSESTLADARLAPSPLSVRQSVDVCPEEVISPTDTGLPARWAGVAKLAKTPGLKGVIVAKHQPHGYEGLNIDHPAGYRIELMELAALGYTETARLAFLRRKGVDPIDLSDRKIEFSVDLRPPFFADDALTSRSARPVPMPMLPEFGGLYDAWAKNAEAANSEGIKTFLLKVSSLPIWLDLRRATRFDPLSRSSVFVDWKAPEPFPIMDNAAPPPAFHLLANIPPPGDLLRTANFPPVLDFMADPGKPAIGLDLRLFPASQWDQTLSQWLRRSL